MQSGLTPIFRQQNRVRSAEKLEKDAIRRVIYRARQFMEHAPVFVTSLDMESLKNKKRGEGLNDMEDICENVLSTQDDIAFSAQYVDKNEHPLVFYLANRWRPTEVRYYGESLFPALIDNET